MEKSRSVRLLLMFSFLLVLLMNSCMLNSIPFIPNPKPTYSPQPDWLTEWLNTPTCQPPCWENIIPGETNVEQAAEIIRELTFVTNVESPEVGTRGLQIAWDFKSEGEFGAVYFDEENIIYWILLDVARFRILSLDDVIAAFGEPDSIKNFECHLDTCLINLDYAKLGMVIFISPIRSKKTFDIVPSDQVTDINFYPIGEEGYDKIFGKEQIPAYPWQGYGEYDIPWE